jgi:hypothetical protein
MFRAAVARRMADVEKHLVDMKPMLRRFYELKCQLDGIEEYRADQREAAEEAALATTDGSHI